AADVEEVLRLDEKLGPDPAYREEARIAGVHVDDPAQPARVAVDAERPVVREPVLVQVLVGADVEGQAAVGLDDEAELVVVQEGPPDPVALDPGGEDAAEDEGVGL